MAVEEMLMNYGVAGAMLLYFMYDKIKFQNSIKQVIENNTIACTKVYEIIKKCDRG